MMTVQPHIKCKKGDVANFAIIPGDPARVKSIASYFDNPKEIAFNREFLTITGKYNGVPVTATSTKDFNTGYDQRKSKRNFFSRNRSSGHRR